MLTAESRYNVVDGRWRECNLCSFQLSGYYDQAKVLVSSFATVPHWRVYACVLFICIPIGKRFGYL